MIKILSEEARIILMQFYSICDGNQLRKSSKSITRISLKLIWKYDSWPWQYCKAARYLIMKAESGKIATWWLLSAAQISRRIEIKITFSTFNCFPSKLKWGRGRVTHTRLELPTNTREVSHLLPLPHLCQRILQGDIRAQPDNIASGGLWSQHCSGGLLVVTVAGGWVEVAW